MHLRKSHHQVWQLSKTRRAKEVYRMEGICDYRQRLGVMQHSNKECYVSSSEFKRMYYDDCEGFERTQIYKEKKNHLIKATDIMAREIATFRNLPEDHV